MSKSTFDLSKLPDLTGHVVLVTGGHSGLQVLSSSPCFFDVLIFHRGLATTKVLARQNAKVYIASRSVQKAGSAIQDIMKEIANANVAVIEMDLSDLDSVKRGAEEFLRQVSVPQ